MANAAVVLAGLVFFLASVGARAHVLLDWPSLRAGLDTFFQVAALGAFLVLLVRRPLWAITLGLTYLLLLTNAFWSLYWPSLRPGIPVQDFLLADQVSANYSWDQVADYLKTTGFMLTLALAARVSWPKSKPGVRLAFGALVIGSVAVNLLAICLQGTVDLRILAAGSGTALDVGRAVGFLEDSGASTVFSAAVLSGAAFVALFGGLAVRGRIIWGVATLAGVLVGAFTGGQVYFVSLALAVTTGIWMLVTLRLSSVRYRVAFVIVSVAVVLAGVSAVLAGGVAGIPAVLADPLGSLENTALAHDSIRAFHHKVMWLAFDAHPLFGTGLGMFYASMHQYRPIVEVGRYIFLADPPASLYMMLLSELGLAGILMMVSGFTWVGVRLVRLTRPAAGEGPDLWTAFAVGASVSLAVSFLVGIHVIFWSVPALAIPIAIGGASEPANGRRWFAPVWGVALLLIAISCVKLWATAPRAPEFRWKERGTPQIPVSLVVPIWPAGLEGIWASSGAEFLFEGKPLWFHIERPAEFYPMTFTIQVFDRGGRQVTTHEQVFEAPTGTDPGRLIQVPFNDDINNLCSTNITPDDYCSFRITTTPEWTLDKQPVAVLYVTRNLR